MKTVIRWKDGSIRIIEDVKDVMIDIATGDVILGFNFQPIELENIKLIILDGEEIYTNDDYAQEKQEILNHTMDESLSRLKEQLDNLWKKR